MRETATGKKVKPGQLALAWMLSRGEDIVPIAGTAHIHHLEESMAALNIALSEADFKRLNEAAPPSVTTGPRYPEAAMKHVNG